MQSTGQNETQDAGMKFKPDIPDEITECSAARNCIQHTVYESGPQFRIHVDCRLQDTHCILVCKEIGYRYLIVV